MKSLSENGNVTEDTAPSHDSPSHDSHSHDSHSDDSHSDDSHSDDSENSNLQGESPLATALFDYGSAEVNATKEECDVLFAIAALQSGRFTGRQLSRATTNWTIHGNRSLALHLEDEGLVSGAESEELQQSATAWRDAHNSNKSSKSWEFACQVLGLGQNASTNAPNAPRATPAQYTLIRRFGHSSKGNVWLARDESLNRMVVIKEIGRRAADSPANVARFYQEAKVTGLLEHPHIVPIYQFGCDAKRGTPFYAMRFVGHKTLADAILEYHVRCKEGFVGVVELHRLLNSL